MKQERPQSLLRGRFFGSAFPSPGRRPEFDSLRAVPTRTAGGGHAARRFRLAGAMHYGRR